MRRCVPYDRLYIWDMKRVLPLLLLSMVAIQAPVSAQERTKIDFRLESYLQRDHASGTMVDLFVRGHVGAVSSAVKAHGGLVKMTMNGLVSARVPVSYVRELALLDAVEGFEFSLGTGGLLCDSMRVKAHVNEVQAGLPPLPQAYDGEGVVVGIFDTGLDVAHPDFQNADGTTRVAYYWDQSLSGVAPAEFGYGQEWTRAQIDAGQMTSTDNNAHGTTVAGAAVGNGLATGHHKGVAPKADIIIVQMGNTQDFMASVVDGVKYVFDRAEAMGKPAVVNLSVGSRSGSHDGLDAAALLIDSMVNARRGRAVVCAAGNENQAVAYHLHTEVDADTSFTWFLTNPYPPPANLFPYPNLFFEVWADAADFANVQYAIGADRYTPDFGYRGRTPFHDIASNLGVVITDPLVSSSGNLLGTVQYFAEQRGEQIKLQVFMPQPDSAYYWRFMTTGSGRFDCWSTAGYGVSTSNIMSAALGAALPSPYPTIAQYPPMANYVEPDNNQHMVDSWACSDNTFTVANYWNVTEYTGYDGTDVITGGIPFDISPNSSAGPTRDLRWKPDMAAPGDITMSAAPLPILASFIINEPYKVDPDGMHIRNGGTSMASPVVAGAVALYLQKCPNASWAQIRQAFLSTLTNDALTGTVPNIRFGYGRVHAFNALVSSNLPDIIITSADDEMCSNATVEVTAPPSFDAYLWSNGSTDNPTAYTGAGPLTVVASNGTGCAHSNALTFTLLDAPPTPVITPNGADLTSNVGPSYQWYLNGQPINGAIGQQWTALANGDYTVEHTATNGCSAISAPVTVIISGLPESGTDQFRIWPSPTNGQVWVNVPTGGPARVRIFDAAGKLRKDQRTNAGGAIEFATDGLSAGIYLVRVERDGAKWEARFTKLP